MLLPPVCPLNCSSHPDHWDPPPARKAGWAPAPSQTAARSRAAPASHGPSVPCAAPGPAGHRFSSSSFSLSAQAQQWGPATGGPASQGEVPGGLHDSRQRLLSGLGQSPEARWPRGIAEQLVRSRFGSAPEARWPRGIAEQLVRSRFGSVSRGPLATRDRGAARAFSVWVSLPRPAGHEDRGAARAFSVWAPARARPRAAQGCYFSLIFLRV